jgi:hypothetical protein
MSAITVGMRAVGSRVVVMLQGEPVGTLDWQAAKERAIELKVCAQTSIDGRVGFVLQTDGRPLCMDLDKDAALKISAGLHAAGALAEESATHEKLTLDQALMIRMGAPFGLAHDQRIRDQAWADAQWDSALRKAMPLKGIPSQAKFGHLIVAPEVPTKQ